MTARIVRKTFESSIVDVDGKTFVRCTFKDCALRYSGGQFSWDEHTLLDGCAWEFKGDSSNVEKLRSTFGAGRFSLHDTPVSVLPV